MRKREKPGEFSSGKLVSKALPCDKCSGKAKCARTLLENAPGKQNASAHCPETLRGSKVRPHLARKRAGKAVRTRAKPENVPGKAVRTREKPENVSGKQCANAQSPKMREGSNVRTRKAEIVPLPADDSREARPHGF